MTTILIITGTLILIFIIRNSTKSGTNKKNTTTDGSMNISVSWEHVQKKLNSSNRKYKQCPSCRLKSDELHWFAYSTSSASWRNLAGRKGFYSKCPYCELVVENILVAMN